MTSPTTMTANPKTLAEMEYTPTGPLLPRDGTPPFWPSAKDRGPEIGYDSDDFYTTDGHALVDFDLRTREQKLGARSKPDTRFGLTTYRLRAPIEHHKPVRGFSVKGADTMVSLSPNDRDVIRSDTLAASHAFFRVGFSGRWNSNKLITPLERRYSTIRYRYELEFDADGATSLIGKREATPHAQRIEKLENAKWAWHKFIRNDRAIDDMFDEYSLKLAFARSEIWTARNALHGSDYQFFCRVAHYLGFEMLCGFPATMYSEVEHNLCTISWENQSGLRASVEAKVLILLKLFEWVNAYASFKALGCQIERLILGPQFGESVVEEYPHTMLRIAKLIQGKELFKLALGYAVREFDCPQYYCNIRDDDCHSSREDPDEPSNEDHESVYSVECDDDGIDVHTIPDARSEQTRYDDLDRQLGHDETLSNRVLRMHSLLSEYYHTLHNEIDTLKLELEHGAAKETAQLAWHSWFAIISTKPVCEKAIDLRSIARGDLKPAHMLHQYQMMHYETTSMNQEKRQQILDYLQSMLSAARLALEDSSVADDDCDLGLSTSDTWNFSGQFEGYRYPWQSSRGKATMLSNIFEDSRIEE